ncbi:hypothetical protein [Spirillospora sp. CA-294931]|uniref:hypothetical protein n=1 Tax=Spirillospora sp. CA-294931 TaxID=3240042 RepID=UPI003D9479A8
MIVCYAHGDGLGHLTRLRAALHTLGETGPVTVLSGSPFAADTRVTGGWTVRPGADLASLAPRELIVDAFPAGRRGELTASAIPPGARVTHLARLLRWDVYAPLLPDDPPRFDRTFVLEPLADGHRAHLDAVSAEVVPLDLVDPPAVAAPGTCHCGGTTPHTPRADPSAPPRSATGSGPDGWLIVHSGPDAEILELVAYAEDMAALEGVAPRLTVVAPRRPEGLAASIGHLDVYPAWPLARHAERIVTAAGFNAVRQFAPWRERHRVLPFPRTLDDQFARAARLRVPEPPDRR